MATLARRLLGCPDPDSVIDDTWLALTRLCRLTPGLRVLAVSTRGPIWRVTRACGDLASAPMGSTASLPPAPVEPVMVERPLYDTYAFDTAAGQRCSWTAIHVPTAATPLWLILGVPPSTRPEALTPPRTVAALMSLALRHHSAHPEYPAQPAGDPLPDTRTPAPDQIRPTAADNREPATPETLDLEDITEAVRQTGDEILQQLAELLQHQDGHQADDDTQQLARLTADMVNDISSKVIHRVSTALAETPADAQPALEQSPRSAAASASAVQAHSGSEAPKQASPRGKDTHAPSTTPAATGHDSPTASSTAAPGIGHAHRFSAEELQAAVAADEIVMRYQPIMSATGDQCTGVEALPRWQHAHHGLLGPAQFLHHTADSAGARAIGTHVLRQAVTEGSRWHQRFPDRPIPVHVNVSGYQLDDDTFAATVRDCLHHSALPAPSLVLEVTDDPATLSHAARTQLRTVAADGVQIAVSLDQPPASDKERISQWRDLPINIVKLNGTATTPTETTTGDRPETILEMARRLGLRTVAERVEDTGQQDRLRDAGADSTQGYLHTPPITADALTDWLHDRRPATADTDTPTLVATANSNAN